MPLITDSLTNLTELCRGSQLQKLYSSPLVLCLSLYGAGQQRYLWIGRGKSFCGLMFGERIPADRRCKDKFHEFVKARLQSSIFQRAEIKENGTLEMVFTRGGKAYEFGIFYSQKKLYFYFQDENSSFCSWRGSVPKSSFSLKFQSETTIDQHWRSEKVDFKEIQEREEKYIKKTSGYSKKLKFLKRKEQKIVKDLDKLKKWKLIQQVLIAGAVDFEKEPVVIEGVKFKVPRGTSPMRKKDLVFNKIKNFKKHIDLMESRHASVLKEIEEHGEAETVSFQLKTLSPEWRQGKKTETKKIEKKNYQEIQIGKFKAAIGLSAQGNDEVRKIWAKKEDYWFHLDGETSAHIIVKCRLSDLTEEIFSQIAKVFKERRSERSGEVDLVFTQVKNLKGIARTPGAVNYKNEKRRRVLT